MVEYFYEFNVQVKGKWVNRTLVDVMSDNFVMKSLAYYEMAILTGVITVNRQIVEKSYVLKDGDSIQHLIHYHEPDQRSIPIISIEDEYLVTNKPSGIACHPTGGYNQYSVTRILENYGNLSCINRLDVVTSGVLILAFKNARKYHSQMIKGKIQKFYLAKVRGKFPGKITVDKKLEKNRQNTTFVSENGKESLTNFKLLKYMDGYSLVECQPITGRSHQIRVHLKSLGFPIINDPVYNEDPENFFHESNSTDFITDKHAKNTNWACSEPSTDYSERELFALKNCQQIATRAFRNINAFICLHAFRYEFNEKTYVADPPSWATDFNYKFTEEQ